MTGNVALNVAIGVIFIFLLYSILSSVIAEIIASILRLRAKNLANGIARLLEEDEKIATEKHTPGNWGQKKWHQFLQLFEKNNHATNKLYQHPSIKYLSKKGQGSRPSYIPAKSFSKAVVDILKEGESQGRELDKIKNGLENSMNAGAKLEELKIALCASELDKDKIKEYLTVIKTGHFDDPVNANKQLQVVETELKAEKPNILKIRRALAKIHFVHFLSGETAKLIESFLDDAKGDIDKFKLLIEEWFNSTMDRISGWYKRKNHLILLFIGFILALLFNVDTIEVIKKLAKDDNARGQIVELATSYVENNPQLANRGANHIQSDSVKLTYDELNAKLDSLLEVKASLDEDIEKANSIMGFQLPDSLTATLIPSNRKLTKDSLLPNQRVVQLENAYYLVSFPNQYMAMEGDGFYYFKDCKVSKTKMAYFDIAGHRWRHTLGYLITALAISLGATFWFDLLNKIVKLRTSNQISSTPPSSQGESGVSPLNTVG